MTAKTESPTDTHDDQQPLAGERTGKDSGRERVATHYPLHPVCADYADFTGAEADAMRESLRKLGRLVTPIALWRDQIVDGRHREMFCRELGIDLRYDDLTDRCPTEEAMRAHVAALNEHRRARTTPLTIKEKRTKVDAALKADPKRSDRAIDEATGTSDPFVAKRRKKLSKKGANVSTPPAQRRSRKGKSGEGQHTEPQPIHQPPAHPAKAAVVVNHPAAAGRPIGDPGPAGAGHPIGDPAVPAVAGENKDAERAADEAFARHLIGLMEMDYASARTVAAYLREHGAHLLDPDIEDDNLQGCISRAAENWLDEIKWNLDWLDEAEFYAVWMQHHGADWMKLDDLHKKVLEHLERLVPWPHQVGRRLGPMVNRKPLGGRVLERNKSGTKWRVRQVNEAPKPNGGGGGGGAGGGDARERATVQANERGNAIKPAQTAAPVAGPADIPEPMRPLDTFFGEPYLPIIWLREHHRNLVFELTEPRRESAHPRAKCPPKVERPISLNQSLAATSLQCRQAARLFRRLAHA